LQLHKAVHERCCSKRLAKRLVHACPPSTASMFSILLQHTVHLNTAPVYCSSQPVQQAIMEEFTHPPVPPTLFTQPRQNRLTGPGMYTLPSLAAAHTTQNSQQARSRDGTNVPTTPLWYKRDGMHGKTAASQLAQHRKRCAVVGVNAACVGTTGGHLAVQAQAQAAAKALSVTGGRHHSRGKQTPCKTPSQLSAQNTPLPLWVTKMGHISARQAFFPQQNRHAVQARQVYRAPRRCKQGTVQCGQTTAVACKLFSPVKTTHNSATARHRQPTTTTNACCGGTAARADRTTCCRNRQTHSCWRCNDAPCVDV
jgi:hypothetical protein